MHFDFFYLYHEQSISYKVHPIRHNTDLYACWVILHAFLLSAVCFIFPFILINAFKKILGEYHNSANSLDLDQVQYFVRPYLVPKCGLSIDDNSRQKRKNSYKYNDT